MVERENDGLESELDGALFHSIRQRRFTAMEETEASTQFDNTCEAKALNSHGQRQLEAGSEPTGRLKPTSGRVPKKLWVS